MADIPGNSSTTYTLINGTQTSSLEVNGDVDWWRMTAVAGRSYSFLLNGTGPNAASFDGKLTLYDANGTRLGYVYDGARLSFTAASTGTYYLEVSDSDSYANAEGTYSLAAELGDTVLSGTATTAVLANGTTTGTLEAAMDSDWFKVSLTAGRTADFLVSGTGPNAASFDGKLTLYDANGTRLAYVYDGARLSFTPTTTVRTAVRN